MRTTCECGNEITRGICIECDALRFNALRLASKVLIKRLEAEKQRLKAVIEEMKSCFNCRNYPASGVCESGDRKKCNNKSKWEARP